MRQPRPFTQLIEEHLAANLVAGHSPATIVGRRVHLAEFGAWCDGAGLTSLDAVTAEHLDSYRQWLASPDRPRGRVLCVATQANRLSAVRSLFAWAVRTKRLTANPASELLRPRVPKHLPRAVFTQSEVERVLSEPNVRTQLGLRDRALMEVLYSTGIRRMEVVGLDLRDVDAERGVLSVRDGKGRKDRVVPIGARALRWIDEYLRRVRPALVSRRGDDCGALFVNARGARVRPTRLTERLRRYITHAGVAKPGSVHIFRHTAATLMHERGADIRDLQEILGHAELSTTAIYTHVSIPRLKAVHARTHPARAPRCDLQSVEWGGPPMPERAYGSVGMSASDDNERTVKAQLANAVVAAIDSAGLTQTAAALLMGVDQPAVSRLRRGRLSGFSAARLFRFLRLLGRNVEIVVRARADSGVRGDLRCVVE